MRLNERLSKTFTQSYSQPDSYHFCLETVIAAELISTQIEAPRRIADLGAGCGVFGMELAHRFPQARLDSFELQEEFKSFFEQNQERCPQSNRIQFFLGDLRRLQFNTTYDLVVGNIPFFDPNESHLSEDALKNNCRFLLNGDTTDFLAAVDKILEPDGSAFILCRDKPLRRALVPVDLAIVSRIEIRESVLVHYKKQKAHSERTSLFPPQN